MLMSTGASYAAARSRPGHYSGRLQCGGPAVGTDGEQHMSEAQIAVHWREEAYVQPSAAFIGQANADDPAILDRFKDLGADCMGRWVIYWRQNMPGVGNHAKDDEGRPMKNWWPFLFY